MRNEKLVEATMLALRGRLNESTNSVLDKNEIAEFLKEAITDLTTTEYTCSWYTLDKDLAIFVGWTEGYDADDPDYIHAKDDPTFVIAAKIASTHEYMKTDLDWLVQPYYEDGEVWDTEITLNNNRNFTEDADWFIKSYKGIREALNRGELLLENKKQEARNPENDEINTKIRKSLNGSTKYIGDLEDAGLEVSQNDNGKVYRIGKTVKDDNGNKDYIASRGMDKQDLKNSHPDTDYYNYLTKKKVAPEVTDTGAFTPTNPFRNSDSFEKTVSTSDRTVYQSDENGVSKAIPKKYKTGRRNTRYNPDKFPIKDYNGVASYEPLDNQELNDFKYNKSKVSDDGWLKRDLDKAKAEYDSAKAEYDKVNDQVQGVRDRIAKSKANRKAHDKITRENIKVTEAIDENLKSYTITVSDGEQEESFEFLSENDFETVCDEVYSNVIY